MSKKKDNIDALDSSMMQEESVMKSGGSQEKEISLKEYHKTAPFSFSAKNYRWLLIGLAINVLGFILMIGGATEDPSKFNEGELFSPMRITIAPMLIVAGYVVIMYSIMKKPKAE